jgi:hypothetical protein
MTWASLRWKSLRHDCRFDSLTIEATRRVSFRGQEPSFHTIEGTRIGSRASDARGFRATVDARGRPRPDGHPRTHLGR